MKPDDWAKANRTYGPTAALPGPRDPTITPYIIEPRVGIDQDHQIIGETRVLDGKISGRYGKAC
jgi:hypothetical protein